MPITIDEIKKDIVSGKSKTIYYSANTLWWTHLDSDVEESTEIGTKRMLKSHKAFMKDGRVPISVRKDRDRLFKMATGSEHTPPKDVSGSVLMMMDSPLKWVFDSEKKPEHFGRNGIDAFIKSHHQNCCNIAFTSWDECNMFIDNTK